MSLIVLTTAADITGDGNSHPLAASGQARWVQVIAGAANAGVVRIGDGTVTSTRGLPIARGSGMLFPPVATDAREGLEQHTYALASIYYNAATNDTLSVTWGN